MKDLVVCISDAWYSGPLNLGGVDPVKGGIYEVIGCSPSEDKVIDGKPYRFAECYVLRGFKYRYAISNFRPVDNTFGEAIEEIISKQVEVEEMEKISV